MKSIRLLMGLLAVSGCSRGTNFDLALKGTLRGQPADIRVRVETEFPTSGTLGNNDGLRDVAPLLVLAGGTDTRSTVSGTCSPAPCQPVAELYLLSPPPLVYAGDWKAQDARLTFKDLDFESKQTLAFTGSASHFTMTFDPPVFSSGGRVVATNSGTVDGAFISGADDLRLSGRFNLAYECHEQENYYRFCGNGRGADGESNPLERPYTENTCPAELVAPYEASPTWTGDTLKLGDVTVNCRHTESGPVPILCYLRRTVTAAGCTWDVHFLTDGSVQQFAVAAFAKGDCAVAKTCNTYR